MFSLYRSTRACTTGLILLALLLRLNAAEGRLIGSPAPDFTLADLSSSPAREYVFSRTISRDNATAVALCFFASWCRPCREELMLFKSLTDSLYKSRLSMVAVCIEEEYGPVQREFVKSTGLACPVLSDPKKETAKLYRMKQMLPYSVIITRNGTVYTTVSGYSPRAERYIYLTLDKLMKTGVK